MKLLIMEDEFIKKTVIDQAISGLKITSVSFSHIDELYQYICQETEPFILISEILSVADIQIEHVSKAVNLPNLIGIIFLSQYDEDIIEMTRHIGQTFDFDNVHGLSLPNTLSQIREKVVNVIAQNDTESQVKYIPLLLDKSVVDYAWEQDLFVPYFQAQFSSLDGNIQGIEILSRLCMDDFVYIPDCFITTLIKESRITEFTYRILQKSLSLLSEYPEFTGSISLNIDYQSLSDFDFAKKVLGIIQLHHLEPSRLTLEVTENKPMLNTSVLNNLTLFRMAGCALSVDDFGTKFSGFTELLKFPFTEIKIDREYTQNMTQSPRAYKVVKAICAVAQSLDCQVVAEGVETQQQRDLLLALDIGSLQGYFYSKPLPIGEAMALLKH
ncbi:EAL domain-containing protein [Psychromonas sp. PT13]|uniref:EAL domain-containing protein n=1 Tax=Psychromonas sp. PT13 TaxID=3439547 RepID=UPI003EBBBCCB